MAITFDTNTAIQVVNNISVTYPITITDSVSEVIFIESIAVGDDVTTATCGGVSCPLLTTIQQGTDSVLFVHYLVNPPTGTSNVVVTQSVSGFIVSAAKVYKSDTNLISVGTPQTGTDGSANTSHSSSVTITKGGWAVGFMREDTGFSFTAGSATTTRITNTGNGLHSIDSNGHTSGTHTFAGTYGGSCKESFITVEISDQPTRSGFFAFF